MGIKKVLYDNVAVIGIGKTFAKYLDKKEGGFILAYHQIKLELFKQHLEIFKSSEIISLEEMVKRKKEGKSTSGLYSLTVDDCYQSTLPDLCAFCAEKGIPITFFAPIHFLKGKPLPGMLLKNIVNHISGQKVITKDGLMDFSNPENIKTLYQRIHNQIYYEKESEYMNEIESIIEQLIENGIANREEILKFDQPVSLDFIEKQSKNDLLSFQSHTITHQPVIALSGNELEKELVETKQFLQALTNKPVNHFCYPYGGLKNIGTSAQALVAKHYDSAVTMVKGRLNNTNDLYMLPRIDLYNKDTKGRALLKSLTK